MTRTANGAALSAPGRALDDETHYTVEELLAGNRRNGHWRSSPTMLDRIGRVTYSSESDAENAITAVCDLTGDEPSQYRIRGIDGPPAAAPRRSGPTRTYQERRKLGKVAKRVSAELDQRTLDRLNAICEAEGGWSHADMIRAMIDGTWAEMRDAGEIKS